MMSPGILVQVTLSTTAGAVKQYFFAVILSAQEADQISLKYRYFKHVGRNVFVFPQLEDTSTESNQGVSLCSKQPTKGSRRQFVF